MGRQLVTRQHGEEVIKTRGAEAMAAFHDSEKNVKGRIVEIIGVLTWKERP